MSLPNGDFHTGYVDLCMKTIRYLIFASCLKEQLDCFLKISTGLFNRVSLARNIEFGAQ